MKYQINDVKKLYKLWEKKKELVHKLDNLFAIIQNQNIEIDKSDLNDFRNQMEFLLKFDFVKLNNEIVELFEEVI